MQINILGTRGVPAAHGGFETFAHELAPYLVEQGHDVLVYCQPDEGTPRQWVEDEWNGVKRRHFVPKNGGALGTMEFDLACALDVLKQPGVDLVLGYNTAVFNIIQRLRGRRVLMNMDGIEWKRAKWSLPARIWFFINEVAGANLCHVPIADHPEISNHVARRCFKKPVMIPYGADAIETADAAHVEKLGLKPDEYLVSIARIEPENSILEMVQAFSALETDKKCVILGKFMEGNDYHASVKAAAGPNVIFPGAIYDKTVVEALRFHCRAYLHGHQVGGTNPSLVEALGAGNAVLAHDNKFNRWTTNSSQFYFETIEQCKDQMKSIFDTPSDVSKARESAVQQHHDRFLWKDVLAAYEKTLIES